MRKSLWPCTIELLAAEELYPSEKYKLLIGFTGYPLKVLESIAFTNIDYMNHKL